MDSGDSSPRPQSSLDSPLGSSLCTTPEFSDIGDPPQPTVENICCVGAGYVGGPTAAVIAYKNPGIRVSVVDTDPVRIQRWNSRHLPVHEPGLELIVRVSRDGTKEAVLPAFGSNQPVVLGRREPNLFFSTAVEDCVAAADIVFISVNTPTKASGIGAGAATNLAALENAVITVARSMKPGAIIVEKSTVPCGTAEAIRDILALHRPGGDFEVLSNPEFLAEGTAVDNLLRPDRILIGSSQTPSGFAAAMTLRSVYSTWVDPSRILTVNVWSSELAKLVANAMLAQRISSINTISAICDETGAEIDQVARAIGLDSRLGSKFLKSGLGFGGSCFKKDILSLTYLARTLHLPEVADYWNSVLTINEYQRDRFMRKVVTRLNGALVGKKITVLGYTFKQDTNDIRESPAIDIIKSLLSERPAEIAIFDPGCSQHDIRDNIASLASPVDPHVLKPHGPIQPYGNAYQACAASSAVLILTPWSQFRYPPPRPPLPDSTLANTPSSSATATAPDTPLGTLPSQPGLHEREELRTLDAHISAEASGRVDGRYECGLSTRLVEPPRCGPQCAQCQEGARAAPSLTGARSSRLDWERVAGSMRDPKWVFDGRNIVDANGMAKLGFRVENLGNHRATERTMF